MTEKRVSVRISSQGGKELKAELVDIGQRGAQAFGQLERSSQRVGPALQNASYQVADVFTQIAAGADPMRAIAIQLPQLLGGMGMIGAIAGAAAAGLGILFANMDDGVSDAERLVEANKALLESLRAIHEATDAAMQAPKDLFKQFGDYAGQAQKVLEVQRQIAEVRANVAFGQSAAALGEAFGGRSFLTDMSAADLTAQAAAVSDLDQRYAVLMQKIEGFGEITSQADEDRWDALQAERAAMDEVYRSTVQYRSEVAELAGQFGVTAEAAREIAIAAAKVREADDTRSRLAAAQALADEIWESTDGLNNASTAARDLYAGLADALVSGMDLAALGLASGITVAADEASRLAYNLDLARTTKSTVGFQKGQGLAMSDGSYIYPTFGGDAPRGGRSRGGGGGGGGGRSQADRDTEEAMRIAEQLIRGTRSEAETYARVQAQLNVLLAEGKVSQETYNRAMGELAEKYGEAKEAAKAFKDITADLKSAVLDFAVDGTASFDQVAKSIERMMLQAALFGEGPFGKIFGGGGLIGTALSALGVKSFDGGGFTGAGARAGGVDGKGGYFALLHPNELVTDLTHLRRHVAAGSGGGGSGGATVQIVDQRRSGAAVETEARTGPDGRQIIVATIRDAEARGDLDGSKRARFGLRPSRVIR